MSPVAFAAPRRSPSTVWETVFHVKPEPLFDSGPAYAPPLHPIQARPLQPIHATPLEPGEVDPRLTHAQAMAAAAQIQSGEVPVGPFSVPAAHDPYGHSGPYLCSVRGCGMSFDTALRRASHHNAYHAPRDILRPVGVRKI